MRSVALLAFAAVLAATTFAQPVVFPHPGHDPAQQPDPGGNRTPVTFVKKLGALQRLEVVFSMCASADGNLYVAGKQGDNPMIAKITTLGEPVWVRNFPPIHPNEPIEWASIIEDSEGMVVVCGTEGASPSNRRAIVMRYDPFAGAVLWYKRYTGNRPVGMNILEKSPGGDFVLQTNFQTVVSGGIRAQTEFFTLQRTDGNTVGSSVSYQSLNNNIVLAGTAMKNGDLYTVGGWSIKATDELQLFFAKVSPTTFIPEWAYLQIADTASGAARWMPPADIAFDGDDAIIAGAGHLNPFTATEQIFVYLQKSHPDGSLAWIKRYDMAMVPEEVLPVQDAYVIFGRIAGTNQLGMLKTDVNGNVLLARVLTLAPASPISVGFSARQNLALRLPDHLLYIDHTQELNESDIVLLRTDLDFGLEEACDAVQTLAVTSQTLSATIVQASLGIGTNTPASVATNATADFKTDSLPVRPLCTADDPDSCQASTFLRVYGDTIKQNNIAALRLAPDGNIYVAGGKADGYAIGKMTPAGNLLWLRNFTGTTQDRVFVTEIIVDSDGMIAGSGERNSVSGNETVVFRYNPLTNQMLWEQRLGVNNPAEGGILEKNPGGNFLVYHSPQKPSLPWRTGEILELNRATGQIVPAFARRYTQQTQEVWAGMVQHNGALYATGYTDSLLPGNQIVRRMILTKLDANTGDVLWTRLGLTPWSQTSYFRGFDLVVDDSSLVVLSQGIETSNTTQGAGKVVPVYLHKTTLDGELLWSKKYLLTEVPREVVAVPDGYIIFCGNTKRHLLKTDKAGNLLFAKVLNTPGYFSAGYEDWQKNQIERAGQFLYTTDLTARDNAIGQYTTVLKTDLDLGLEFDCGLELLNVPDTAMTNPVLFAASQTLSASPAKAQPVVLTNSPGSISVHQACPFCPVPPCDSIATQQILEFYPGDTVSLAGTLYTQPDTVTLTLSADGGCDSVVTYILRLVLTNVDLACPSDMTVAIPAGQSSAPVSYPLPAAATDCPNTAIALTRLQGPAPGGLFPEGTTLVCYEAANQCGIRDTCCFQVTAQKAAEETACDVKIPPGSCIKYELLSIRLDSLGRPRYRMRLTNTCASPLRFAYFQIPKGMTAKVPADGATYTAPGGNTYLVRNPNAAPYHSIRFKPVSGALNNGKSDIFEYTLPKQAQMTFILVSASLENGSSSEAHINTFGCPVQPYTAKAQEPGGAAQNRYAPTPATSITIRPNPTQGLLFVEAPVLSDEPVLVSVFNAQGQQVLEMRCAAADKRISLLLPEALADGLYYLRVQAAGVQASSRFVLARTAD